MREQEMSETAIESDAGLAKDRVARGSKMHRLDCRCCVCEASRRRKASGRPTKAEERALRREQRERVRAERRKAESQRRSSTPQNARERRLVKETALVSALAGQAAVGARPNIAAAARIAGMDASQATKKVHGDESLQAALDRAGITDEKLFEVAGEGLDAFLTRILTDKNGNVTDTIKIKDFHAIHKFWRDLLMVKGYLGREEPQQQASGGLIIIANDAAKVVPGHSETCMCDECIAAWEEKTKELRQLELKRHAIEAEIIETAPDGAPTRQDSGGPGPGPASSEDQEEDFYELTDEEKASLKRGEK